MISQHVARLARAVCLCLWAGGTPAAAADCGRKVEAEFQRLQRSGVAYRIETAFYGEQQGRSEIFEFVPPDRMRLKYRFKEGNDWADFVRVDDRIWDHEKELPGGLELAELFDEHTKGLGRPLGVFECLGPIRFSGKTYTGYRTYHFWLLANGVRPAERRAYWRTVLVDRKTGALAREIATPEKKLNNPKWQKRYTYPNDIAIDPPRQ